MNEHATNSSAGWAGGSSRRTLHPLQLRRKVAILIVLFALEVAALWHLLPW
jgi:hypothetical protein